MARTRTDVAWLVQVTEEYGTRKIKARIVVPQEDGELHSPDGSWRFNDKNDTRRFADLTVECYLGSSSGDDERGRLWGFGTYYYPHRIEFAERAREMANTLSRIEKGLQTIATDLGYLKDDDFAGYLGRVGQILGVTTYYVGAGQPVFFNSGGERWRKVDMTTVQYWLREVCKFDADQPSKLRAMLRY